MNRKREAVPKHSLPPQEQIFTYWGRFTKCPYETVQKSSGFFFYRPFHSAVFSAAQSYWDSMTLIPCVMISLAVRAAFTGSLLQIASSST